MNGVRLKKPFLLDIEEMLTHIDIGGAHFLTHWCCITESSPEYIAGQTDVGEPCCSSAEEAVEKVVCSIDNVVFGRSWESACASRWTYISKLRQRYLIACFASGAMHAALRGTQIDMKAQDSIE